MVSRRERFKELVAPNRSLCLQIFACVSKHTYTPEEFNELAKQHKADFTADPVFVIPRTNRGERLFNQGYLINGANISETRTVQAIFTSECDYHIYDKTEEDLTQIMEGIIGNYIPEIEEQNPALRFDGEHHAKGPAFSIEFKYAVHSYDPATCHPNDQGRLMPITVIEGQTIHPQPQNAEEKPVPVIELP